MRLLRSHQRRPWPPLTTSARRAFGVRWASLPTRVLRADTDLLDRMLERVQQHVAGPQMRQLATGQKRQPAGRHGSPVDESGRRRCTCRWGGSPGL
jgi:hypothetical protein